MKIRQVGAELFHADGQDETNSRFSKFYESAQKKERSYTFRICLSVTM
jgi:hypothetical protein